MTAASATKVHKFEAAGLGLAPFRFMGIQTTADRAGEQKHRESSGQTFTTNHCTSCDYCSQAIHNAYCLQSADGKRFKVGCDCIRKSGDAGLIRIVGEEESSKRRAATKARREAKWTRERDLIAAFKSGRCETLQGQPHPKGREGATAYDYVAWCVDNRCCGKVALDLIAGSIQ